MSDRLRDQIQAAVDRLVAEAPPLTPEQRQRLAYLLSHAPVRRCLVCGSAPATHRFAVLGGPDGWLCEGHKDDAVTVDGVEYGQRERRAQP